MSAAAAAVSTALPVVCDIEPVELPLLPPATADFLLILLAWCMIGWGLRIAYLVLSLREVMQAQAAGRLLCFDNVPMHSLVVPLDVDTRHRFLGFLRARVPPMPTAESQAYTSPVALKTARLVGPRGAGTLELTLDCMLPATLQLFWGVDASEVANLVRLDGTGGASPGRSHSLRSRHTSAEMRGSRGGRGGGGGGGANAPGSPAALAVGAASMARTLSSCVRSHLAHGRAPTQPVVRQLSAIEMSSCSCSQLHTAHGCDGCGGEAGSSPGRPRWESAIESGGESAVSPGGIGIRAIAAPMPTHALLTGSYSRCSEPIAVAAGVPTRLVLRASETGGPLNDPDVWLQVRDLRRSPSFHGLP